MDLNHAAATDNGPGTAAAPYRSISAAMKNLRPGDDVVVAAGVYREAVVVPTLAWGSAQTRLRAQTAHTVTVKGTALVSGWVAQGGGVFAVPWTGEEPQQVFRDGVPLKQVGGTVFGGFPALPQHELAKTHASEGGIWPGRVPGGLAELVPDSFTYEAATRRLLVKPSAPLAAGQTLEVSVLRHVLQAENASGFTVQGLDFAHANTSFTYRQGAVKMQGPGNVLKDIAVRDMDGICVQLIGDDSTLQDSTLERCGQMGLNAYGRRLTIAGNRVTHGNTRGFNKWWEAGGMKLIGVSGLHDSTIRNNVVAFNQGDGIWVDWKNTQVLIEGNTAAYNQGFGIQYEASQAGTIRNNLAYGNAMRGIYLLESSGTLVQGNAVFGNQMEGIAVVDGTRSAADPTLRPMNNTISGNTLAWNDYQRNWVQLVLPGVGYGTVSDRNSFKAEGLAARMSLGFVGNDNPAYEQLGSWQAAARFDALSVTQLLPMPASLKAALAAQRLLLPGELPAYLGSPGTF